VRIGEQRPRLLESIADQPYPGDLRGVGNWKSVRQTGFADAFETPGVPFIGLYLSRVANHWLCL